MAHNNSINIPTPFPLNKGGTGAALVASNGGIIYSTASTMAVLAGTPTAGQFLQSGANSAPSWSTATFPTVGGPAGNILISNGTNYIASTSLWPNTVGAVGKLIRSDGTVNAYTTATYPNVATGTGTILRADGTNWVPSTATFADTYAASALLYSNGANTVTGLTPANSAVLLSTSAGVPVWSSSLTDGQLIIGSTGATPAVASLSAGTNITITPGAGTISIAAVGAGVVPAALSKADDTNVTLTLTGTPATALLQAVTITAGWAGQLSLSRGGTEANLTAAAGGVVYSGASALAISAVGSSGQLFQSTGTTAPGWTTATFPATAGSSGNVLTSDGTNFVSQAPAAPGGISSIDYLLMGG